MTPNPYHILQGRKLVSQMQPRKKRKLRTPFLVLLSSTSFLSNITPIWNKYI